MINKLFLLKLLFIEVLLSQYSELGPYELEIIEEEITVSNNQNLEYTLFSPTNELSNIIIILSHGFSRTASVLNDLARHFASWGMKSVTMDLLHSSIIDNNPLNDALDLNILVEHIENGENTPVIFLGHSAGAMRSIIAASQNSNTVAVFGLDLVDSQDPSNSNENFGAFYVTDLTIPVWGLSGEISQCNNSGNGLNVYMQAINGNNIRITEADHCDFEFPTNFFCTILCQGTNTLFSNDEIRGIIINLSTAFMIFHSEIDLNSIQLWGPGSSYYDNLLNIGAIEHLVNVNIQKESNLMGEIFLKQNYPNPFNSSTKIHYEIPYASFVELTIYDILSKPVAVLVNNFEDAGYKIINWNGLDERGQKLNSGMYFYKINTGYFKEVKKMIILK